MNAGNLVSDSYAFSKPSLYMWKFSIQVRLKSSLKDFEHNLTSIGKKHNYLESEHFLALPFFGSGMKTDFFQVCDHCWVFQIF